MENVSKALLIAGGVLIGIMILSLALSLYASLSSYVESTQEDLLVKRTQQFNEQFTKYINYNEETGQKDFTLTIQDIVTAANTAYENNTRYDLENYEEGNYYVTVNIMPEHFNLEKSKSVEILIEGLQDENGQVKEYKCYYNDVKFDPKTGRVYEVNFSEL